MTEKGKEKEREGEWKGGLEDLGGKEGGMEGQKT